MSSIRRQLIAGLLLAVGTGGIVAAGWTYGAARGEANALFDYHLEQIAWSMRDHSFERELIPPPSAGELENDFVIQIWDRSGVEIYLSRPYAQVPGYTPPGFSNQRAGKAEWRVFSVQVRGRVIQVAQPMRVRERLAAVLALRAAAPIALLVPLLAALVWIIVGRGLRPLETIARAVRSRDSTSLAPLPIEPIPAELAPLVGELNSLLGRLGGALEVQRRFVADAAHELRSPLTALRLQAQLAERAGDAQARARALAELKSGVERATRIVEQLLTLARQGPEPRRAPREPVDLVALAQAVVAQFTELAAQKNIDLGLGRAEPAGVEGDPAGLHALLANLIDNAVRYTPQGGAVDVDVGIAQGAAFVAVSDSGPGIPVDERERVFDRFHRVPGSGEVGSGLGLAIVREVAERHAARVMLDDRPGGGLVVRVQFPAPQAGSGP
ncbi:MAG: sensor histidine kinase N-terminal domain-containing protein [Betaproteobacteria bacterium]|jgi:two-component system OmpR family sensor kinase|nr:sensor histidine kinase N-terminal domain-containing protein [Betaproteobacteria bacterium]